MDDAIIKIILETNTRDNELLLFCTTRWHIPMGEVTRSLKQTERLLDGLITSIEGLESSDEYTAKTEDTILNGMYVYPKLSTHSPNSPFTSNQTEVSSRSREVKS